MRFLIYLTTGLIGGCIGAAAWAGIAYAMGYEIGWIAWVLGFAVGLGVRLGAMKTDGYAPGVTAAVIAVLAVLVGKYFAVSMIVDKKAEVEVANRIGRFDFVASFAKEIAVTRQADGKPIKWPARKNILTAEKREDFPADIWDEATTKWHDLGPAGQQKLRDERKAEFNAAAAPLIKKLVWSTFVSSFSPLDIIFFLLALVTAFKLGAGVGSA